ncbi:MAG: hypothetical protein ACI9AR_000124 [Flavobacteriaceae bacterium]|jgi:hypothetical protein
MDILAHGLYGGALSKALRNKIPKEKRKRFFWWAFLFGILPDFIAFAPSFFIGIFNGHGGHHSGMGNLDLSAYIYNFSHSLIIFLCVLLLVRVISKKWWLPLFAWPLHIIMDIPLHSPDFFPTPFLFPLSTYTLPIGIPWGTPQIFFSLWGILIVYYLIRFLKEKREKRLSSVN